MSETSKDWRASLRAFIHPRVITMLFLGLAAGLPLLLIFSSLSLWLREAGVDSAWITPVMHGFFEQVSCSQFGRPVTMTLMAR